MVLDKLGESLRGALKKVANASNIDQKVIKELVKEIQRALLQADVNVKLTLALTKEIENRAMTEKPKPGMSMKLRFIHPGSPKTELQSISISCAQHITSKGFRKACVTPRHIRGTTLHPVADKPGIQIASPGYPPAF